MKKISKPAPLRLGRHTSARGSGISYERHVAAPRAVFAAPSVDLRTLVIAEAMKRKAQAEIQRDVLRDATYEIPVSPERGHDRGADIHPSDPDHYT
ncbi:hypothetical protein ACAX43_18000 [Paraburkholderia sp. IW21]|uniref:hypothetical protein n=1 Tax=Paraburkholderia sp. IW21 TaxID=3242488 RepID=UPI00351FCC34